MKHATAQVLSSSKGGTQGRGRSAPSAKDLSPWRHVGAYLMAAALGAIHTPAYVHPKLLWPLPLLCLAAFVALLLRHKHRPLRSAGLGWAFGTAWLCAAVWWLFISMHRYGGLPAPLAVLAVLALSAALSLYLALAVGLWARWQAGSQKAWHSACLFAGLWMLSEIARGLLFTGFPWAALGYSQVDSPLAALAPWLGVYGMGAVAALAAARLGLMSARSARPDASLRALGLILVSLLVLLWLKNSPINRFSSPLGDELPVTLIQTNVSQDEKFAVEHLPQALAWLSEALKAAPKGLVVAPETAIPLLPSQLAELEPRLWPGLQSHFRNEGRAALIGIPLGDFERGYTNSVVGLSADALAVSSGSRSQARAAAKDDNASAFWRYDKHHLVPFGEFIPAGFRWFTQMMNIPLGDFARGPLAAPSFDFGGQRLGVNICYEDLFGEELARRFAVPERAPSVMVNVSNIGWFGDSIAIPQHLHITRLRTLELQRPMIRATNTGATAVVDHEAQVLAELPAFSRNSLRAVVQGHQGLTPYTLWASQFGLWPLMGLGLLGVWTGARARL